ncbi:MAG: hypothetical protein EXR81_05180 [Gammaproteobacteria bacterium]|nr:hypothetical protein [Gammaproteobacteria bacterium]
MYQDQKFPINTAVATPPSTLPASRKRPHSATKTPQLVASPSTPFLTPGSRMRALRSKPMSITANFATPENVLKKYDHDDYLLPIDKHVVELYVPLIQFCAVNPWLVASWNSDAAKHILDLIRARAKRIADPADREMENYQHLNALLHEVNCYAIQEKFKIPQDFYSLMYETALIACTNLETLKPRMEVIIFILKVLKINMF